MRRHLLLLRHAKSSWDDPSLSDHDRPLSSRGAKALSRVRKHLAASSHRPEVVLCSSARRAVDTAKGVRTALPKRTTVLVDDELYLADADALLDLLRALPPDTRSAMVIAHNPGMEDLAARLIGSGDEERRRQLAAKYPTGAVVTLSFAGPWKRLGPGAARLDDLFVPRPPRADEPATTGT